MVLRYTKNEEKVVFYVEINLKIRLSAYINQKFHFLRICHLFVHFTSVIKYLLKQFTCFTDIVYSSQFVPSITLSPLESMTL